jgi:hypothetical protein
MGFICVRGVPAEGLRVISRNRPLLGVLRFITFFAYQKILYVPVKYEVFEEMAVPASHAGSPCFFASGVFGHRLSPYYH